MGEKQRERDQKGMIMEEMNNGVMRLKVDRASHCGCEGFMLVLSQ